MKLLKTHKIYPVILNPGDCIYLDYTYQDESDGTSITKTFNIDNVEVQTTVDMVIVYKTENGEYGLKGGRAIVIGEDDGTYKNVPISEEYGLKSRTKRLEEIK